MKVPYYCAVALLCAASAFGQGQAEVVATGLEGPQKLILTPGGNFLVTETNKKPNSGRVSLVTRGGARRTLVDGLPSGTDSQGDGGGPTAMALRDRTLYVAIGVGEIEKRVDNAVVHNPDGLSSPLFASVLAFQFNGNVDTLTGTFALSKEQHQALADGDAVTLQDGAGATAQVSLLADLPNSTPEGAGYRFSNPWGLALSPDGTALWLTDASMNTLSRIDTGTGRRTTTARFPSLPNGSGFGPPQVDAVPTSVRVYGNQLLVSFLTGFPFLGGNARVLAVNPDSRTTEPFIFNITSSTDILWRERAGQASQFYVLEFSTNQLANPAVPGRLLRYESGQERTVVADNLQAPVSLALDAASNELFVLELTGRIVKVPVR
ncbi:MAG TPA: ScyD/ScyE family protein [Bryobacteraceae bacterium]|nr:ScyD/ScyE family protein [Bryobacteraceae bacterium]